MADLGSDLQRQIPRFDLTLGNIGLILATVMATVILHEIIPGLVYRVFGYRVTYGSSVRLMALMQ